MGNMVLILKGSFSITGFTEEKAAKMHIWRWKNIVNLTYIKYHKSKQSQKTALFTCNWEEREYYRVKLFRNV